LCTDATCQARVSNCSSTAIPQRVTPMCS
jgi:hypothetical protein